MIVLTDRASLEHELPDERVGAALVEITLCKEERSAMAPKQAELCCVAHHVYCRLLVAVILRFAAHVGLRRGRRAGGMRVRD